MKKIFKNKEKIAGLTISLIFIGLIVWNIDFQKLLETFKIFDYKTIFVFVPLYILSLYLRGIRWKCLLCLQEKFKTKDAFYIFTAGNTINSFMPARAGDFWRAYHLGNKIQTSKAKILGSIILERIIDGISILLILIYAVISYCKQPWILKITYISSILFIGGFLFFYLALKLNKTEYIFDKIANIKLFKNFKNTIIKAKEMTQNFIEGFQVLNNSKCLILAFASSCLAWFIECLLTYILIHGFGYNFGFSIAMFVISFLALSTVIPSSSIFVGPYQYAYILALGIYNIDKSNGLGIAFIHQFIIMLTITVITIFYFSKTNKNLKEIQTEITQN